MKTETYKLIGVNVELTVPASLDEAAKECGQDRVLEAFVDHIVYHTIATSLRTRVANILEERGLGKRNRTKGESGVEVIDESPAEFIARLRSEGLDSNTLQQVTQEAASSINFVEAVKGRVTAPKQPSAKKVYLGFVQEVAGQGKLEQLVSRLSEALGVEVPKDDLVAIAVHAERYFNLQRQAAMQKLI